MRPISHRTLHFVVLTTINFAVGLPTAWALTEQELARLSPEARIDHLIDAKLEEQGLAPNPDIDDATFLRRAYLDLVGRIPTIGEAENFHSQPNDENKRKQLVDRLLNSEGYVSAYYNFWADILRINARLGINETPPPVEYTYRLWLKDALRKNMPYDALVRELVSARGHFWQNGAIGYYQRDRGMPLDNMSNTIRIFLGVRLECAQCHDHPFDHWTQMDYYKMAAFSYGMESQGHTHPNREALRVHLDQARLNSYNRAVGVAGFPVFPKDRDVEGLVGRLKQSGELIQHLQELHLSEEEFAAAAKRGIDARESFQSHSQSVLSAEETLHVRVRYITTEENDRVLQLPHDYQYSNAKPFDEVSADTMFGGEIAVEIATGGRIDAYAGWLTARDNPTFTRVIANRLWKEVFGNGVFEPLDELSETTTISNPELMDYLEQLMHDLDYDMKAYISVLCATKAYQRAADTAETPLGDPVFFQWPALRRMSAEQIWDSVVGLVLPEADTYSPSLKRQLKAIDQFKVIYLSLAEVPPDEYIASVEELAETMARNSDRKRMVGERRRKAYAEKDNQLFDALSDELVQLEREVGDRIVSIQKTRHQDSSDEELLASFGMVEKSYGESPLSVAGDARVAVTTLRHKPAFPKAPQGLDAGKFEDWRARRLAAYKEYLSFGSSWARASELDSPAPRGHFLREFGQSDRNVIENAAIQASAPQALNLLNGPVMDALTNEFGVFGQRLHAAETPEEKTECIFQAMLTRAPTEQEKRLVQAEIEKYGEEAYEGIVWSLLNTQQFIFVR